MGVSGAGKLGFLEEGGDGVAISGVGEGRRVAPGGGGGGGGGGVGVCVM